MSVPFKVFGLQRTGTNLMQFLLLHNFDTCSLHGKVFEWKHGRILSGHQNWSINGEEVRLIVCVKNPYAWTVSCYKFFQRKFPSDKSACPRFRKEWSFEDFVTRQHYSFLHPIDRWNQMYSHWLDFPLNKKRLEVVLNEEVLTLDTQKKKLKEIQTRQGLTLCSEEVGGAFRHITYDMKMGDKFNSDYYKNHLYLSAHTQKTIDFINAHVNKELLRTFGYPYFSAPTPTVSK